MIGDRVFREITDNVWDPKRRIEEMDATTVSMQVLSTVPVMFSYWAKPADALDLFRMLNDHVAEIVRKPIRRRFAGREQSRYKMSILRARIGSLVRE